MANTADRESETVKVWRNGMLTHMKTLLAAALTGLLLFGASPVGAGVAKIRVACVGDSITVSYAVSNPEKVGYPAVLGTLLGEKYEVRNYGCNGTTLLKGGDRPYSNTEQFKQAGDFKPNIVVVLLGTNDTKPGNWALKAQFGGDYEALIEHFRSLPSKPVVYVCLPVPVYGKGNWGITNENLQEVLPIVRQVAKKTQAPLIDLNTPLDKHPEWFPDLVHPIDPGTAALAKVVAEALQAGDQKTDAGKPVAPAWQTSNPSGRQGRMALMGHVPCSRVQQCCDRMSERCVFNGSPCLKTVPRAFRVKSVAQSAGYACREFGES